MKKKLPAMLAAAGLAAALTVSIIAAPVLDVKAAASDDTETSTAYVGSGITLSTDYPGISVKAGNSVSFGLDIANGGNGQIVELSAKSSNADITGYFQGGSNTVNSVYAQNGFNDGLVTYTATIPNTVKDGVYTIELTAKGKSSTSTLTITLNITEIDTAASTMTSDYEEQEGAAGTSFTFNTTLANNSLDTQTYALSATAPTGWTVKFVPSDGTTDVASVDVDGMSTETLGISIVPVDGVEAGDYTIPIYAKSAGESVEEDLKITITGTYSITLTTQNQTYSFDAEANKATNVVLNVNNTGNVDLHNVDLTATTPTDWTVEFSESSIETLAAGETKSITATVTPSSSAISGDYEVDMKAKADESSVTSQFRVTVKTQTVWGIVGIVLILAIIACLAGVFKKFGRH